VFEIRRVEVAPVIGRTHLALLCDLRDVCPHRAGHNCQSGGVQHLEAAPLYQKRAVASIGD
jgi:hypothetical protein